MIIFFYNPIIQNAGTAIFFFQSCSSELKMPKIPVAGLIEGQNALTAIKTALELEFVWNWMEIALLRHTLSKRTAQ